MNRKDCYFLCMAVGALLLVSTIKNARYVLGVLKPFTAYSGIHIKNPDSNGDLYPDCESLTEGQFWEVIERRKRHINRMCQVYKEQNYDFHWKIDWDEFNKTSHEKNRRNRWYSELLIFDKLKLLYQGIQKAGTTNFKSYINNYKSLQGNYSYGQLTFLVNGHRVSKDPHDMANHKMSNRSMYKFGLIESVEVAKAKFDSYYKVIFFREPLERIMSTYSFFTRRESNWLRYGPFIKMLKKSRNITQEKQLIAKKIKSGEMESLTPTEFFKYLMKTKKPFVMDHHYRPQMINAMACDIQFDFVGTTKDMSCETRFLMKKLTAKYQNHTAAKRPKPVNETVSYLLSGVSSELIKGVLQKYYKIDYDFLGYPFPKL